jgi:hypothetical protein
MTRPKGYAPWAPSPDVQEVLRAVQIVLEEYRDYLPMTNRQIFYRLVGAFGYAKTETAYKRLCGYLTRARRARIIPFSAIRDDKVSSRASYGYAGLTEFKEGIKASAEFYRLNRLDGQDYDIELWCEAEGMLPQMARVAEPYSVSCYSAGGFLSVTAIKDIANRVAKRGRDTILLHVGDFDPSGESIFDTITDDVTKFVWAMSRDRDLHTVRVALTIDQVDEYDIPTAPPKPSDSRSARWEGETAQAEAMPPSLLAEVVERAISERVDSAIMQEVLDREEEHKEKLSEWLESLE